MKPRSILLIALPVLLGGCALFQDHSARTDGMRAAEARVPAQWQAPLPHDGKVANLKQWWSQFDDPLLAELIAAAEAASPDVAAARSRLYQARADSVGATATLLPSLDANMSGSRGQQTILFPSGTTTSVGLAANWELDLFGANGAASDAAKLRYSGAQADWHAARVSLAADVASSYIGLRACEAQLEQRDIDAVSRKETARLTRINANAGLESPANAALAQAGAAQSNTQLIQQRSQCDIDVKALVALTAIDEDELRRRLAARRAQLPQPAAIDVASVPGAALAQRPDIYSAAQAVLAASADVDNLKAQSLPRITLAGSISHTRFDSSAMSLNGRVWSLGPLTVTMPILDGGVHRANTDAGRARYDEAVIGYGAKLRGAVREVEEALITLQAAADRSADAQAAVDGYATSFKGVEARQKNGLASLFELEDARRSLTAAQLNLVDVQRERVAAWISLYRALGGGWQLQDQLADAERMPDMTKPAMRQDPMQPPAQSTPSADSSRP